MRQPSGQTRASSRTAAWRLRGSAARGSARRSPGESRPPAAGVLFAPLVIAAAVRRACLGLVGLRCPRVAFRAAACLLASRPVSGPVMIWPRKAAE